MISFHEAQTILQQAAGHYAVATEIRPVQDAVGRVCAEPVTSPINIQPFDNSAMDGYAVRLADLAEATPETPQKLLKTQTISAGSTHNLPPLKTGCCAHIMTGAPLPEGAEAVVPVELVTAEGENITFSAAPQHHANIRFAGEDMRAGDALLAAGRIISVRDILPLATAGVATVAVYKKTKVLFLATGDELVSDLTQPLATGQIYNSNMYYATARLSEMGADVKVLVLKDTPEDFQNVLAEHLPAVDMVVSSGGVSAGAFDFVRPGLEAMGADILYHKIKIKPGKPNLLARLPQNKLYFGLPGNPVATAVGLDLFVRPALKIITKTPLPHGQKAVITTSSENKKPLSLFLKGYQYVADDGRQMVDVLDGQASFMTASLLAANCWVHLPEEHMANAGDVVDIYPFY